MSNCDTVQLLIRRRALFFFGLETVLQRDYSDATKIWPLTRCWMGKMDHTKGGDGALVKECLAGSEQAWEKLYRSYVGLVRNVVKRKWRGFSQDLDDIVQSVFLSVINSLEAYDQTYPLGKYISIIAERTCLQEYRRRKAAKRDGETVAIEHHDTGDDAAISIQSTLASQEDQLSKGQLQGVLRQALDAIGKACHELLILRFLEELSYKEISKILGATEGALRVRVSRCLEELAGKYDRLLAKGLRP